MLVKREQVNRNNTHLAKAQIMPTKVLAALENVIFQAMRSTTPRGHTLARAGQRTIVVTAMAVKNLVTADSFKLFQGELPYFQTLTRKDATNKPLQGHSLVVAGGAH